MPEFLPQSYKNFPYLNIYPDFFLLILSINSWIPP